ncbi:uncharacterized protein N7487_010676 [Penicillium crustosum]|uniref:uncharacterized protein n=1 Tax=Penicillium crustosum TaxID=36656 RepID=UPI00239E1538|nr:uncharacterized protein N7487_010676 [Penicillium crustosum]KAJ5396373.1 hypothetical protein N7487_010676 [Penicillium crustosum]
MDTVPSEPEYRDLVVGLTTQLLKPTTARLNRAPLTLTDVHELYRHLCSPEFFNNSVLRAAPDEEASPLHGGILADVCGLGKTLTALTLIYQAALVQPRPPYRPTLILVPSALIDTWLLEIERHFGDALIVRLFYSAKTRTGDSERKLMLLESLGEATRTTTEIDENGAPTYRARKATRKETDPMALDLTTAEADVDEDIPDPDDVVTPSVSDEPGSPSSVHTPPTDSVGTPYPPGVNAAVTELSEL